MKTLRWAIDAEWVAVQYGLEINKRSPFCLIGIITLIKKLYLSSDIEDLQLTNCLQTAIEENKLKDQKNVFMSFKQ